MAENHNQLPPLPSNISASLPSSPQIKKKKRREKKEEDGVSSSTPRSTSPQSVLDSSTSKPPTPNLKKSKLKKKNEVGGGKSSRDREATIDNGTESDTPLVSSHPGYESFSMASILDPVVDLSSPKLMKKEKKIVHVTSPITGEKILIPQEDLKFPRKPNPLKQKSNKKKQHLADSSGLSTCVELSSLENLTATGHDDLYIPPVDREMPEVVFAADDGKTYKPIDKEDYEQFLIEKAKEVDQEPILESFAERFLRRRRSVFDFAMAIHAGLCLCTLVVLPTESYSQTPIIPEGTCTVYPFSDKDILNYGTYPLPTLRCFVNPATGINYTIPFGENDEGALFSFLLYYSPKALLLNMIYQIISSLMVVGSWERMVHVMESKRLLGGNRVLQQLVSILLVICAMISFSCNILMIYVDTNLTFSQAEHPSYARYGERYWMFDGLSLTAPYVTTDISEWITCNVLRGLFGLFQYLLWKLMRIKRRQDAMVSIKRPSSGATIRIQPVP